MVDVPVTVAENTAFSVSNDSYIFDITVTNTTAVPCTAGTYAYYEVTLTGTAVGENPAPTKTYTLKAPAAGPISASTAQLFEVEGDTTLGTLTAETGKIYYTPES